MKALFTTASVCALAGAFAAPAAAQQSDADQPSDDGIGVIVVGGGLVLIAVVSGALSLGILKNSQPADLLR